MAEPDLYGINVAKQWLETCSTDSYHAHCHALGSLERVLPRRLLYISPSEPYQVKLVETKTLPTKEVGNCEYLALSHCWGSAAKVPKTTSATLKQHLGNIAWDYLSRTFQDAVTVTRLLGYRYLWIDSFCIVQDEAADFDIECARMHFTYLFSTCMIAASDATCGEEGFLWHWDAVSNAFCCDELSLEYWGTFTPINDLDLPPSARPAFARHMAREIRRNWRPEDAVDIAPLRPTWASLASGPLHKRGWACQERQLAPRILHYTRHGVMWECRRCIGLGDSNKLYYRGTSLGLVTDDDEDRMRPSSDSEAYDIFQETRSVNVLVANGQEEDSGQDLDEDLASQILLEPTTDSDDYDEADNSSSTCSDRHNGGEQCYSYTESEWRILDEFNGFHSLEPEADAFRVMPLWRSLVEDYSARKFTFPSDKLPALSGMASIIQGYWPTVGLYIAGVWNLELPRQLYWSSVRDSETESHSMENKTLAMFPSWSWMSWNGAVSFNDSASFRSNRSFFFRGYGKITWDLKGPSERHAIEIVRGCGENLELFGEYLDWDMPIAEDGLATCWLYEEHERHGIAIQYDDEYIQASAVSGSKLRFFFLLEEADGFGHHVGLALQRVESGKCGSFKRVGTFIQIPFNNEAPKRKLEKGMTSIV